MATEKTFEATIWEKAEHWTFEVTVEAADEIEARKRLKKEYPQRNYSVRKVQQVYRLGAFYEGN